MINVQLDLVNPDDEDGEGTAVWSGQLPERPTKGDTLEIRGRRITRNAQRPVTLYRVTGDVHWVLFTEDPACHTGSVIVNVESWDPDEK